MKYFKSPSDEAIRIHDEAVIVDIHCHPSLKMNLFNHKIYDKVHYIIPGVVVANPSETDEIFQLQYDLTQMYFGKVDAIWSSVYVIERDFVENSSLKLGKWGANVLGIESLVDSIERDTPYGPYVQAIDTLEKVEQQVMTASNMGFEVSMAKNFSQFEKNISEGKTCIVQSVEGGHMLGRSLPSTGEYLAHVQTLFDKGVCSMTLGHFMVNNLCFPVRGIAPKKSKEIGFKYDYDTFANEGLLYNGKAVVDLMLDLGMIVDLNHVTIPGRIDVFRINESKGSSKRPLVFSHNGLSKNCRYEPLGVMDDEVLEIQKCNGVIGIIFMNYWLTGNEKLPDDGIENIIKTIKDVAKICKGSFDNISIGSDMDGFTQPMDDLYVPSKMIRLTQALIDEGITESDIKKILGGNAMRVMKEGWGG